MNAAPEIRRRADKPKRDEPEHRNDRRRFLIYALMLGAIKPERVSERIVAELEGETHDQAAQ